MLQYSHVPWSKYLYCSLQITLYFFFQTAIGLQNQLSILYHLKNKQKKLNLNFDKSGIIGFRKGSYLAALERWSRGNDRIEVVNAYKYLALYFTTKLRFSFARNYLAARGKRRSWEFEAFEEFEIVYDYF